MIRKFWKLLQSFYRAYHTVKMTHADLERSEAFDPWTQRKVSTRHLDYEAKALDDFEVATACVKWGKAMRDRQKTKERLS